MAGDIHAEPGGAFDRALERWHGPEIERTPRAHLDGQFGGQLADERLVAVRRGVDRDSSEPEAETKAEMNDQSMTDILWRGRALIAVSLLVAVGAAALVTSLESKVYQAKALIQVISVSAPGKNVDP